MLSDWTNFKALALVSVDLKYVIGVIGVHLEPYKAV